MIENIITCTDSYKMCHWHMYPENTTKVYSYFESRNGSKFNNTLFFGLQYIMKRWLQGKVVTQEKIEQAERLSNAHFGNSSFFNRKMWQHILDEHDGLLPVSIKAVPEGLIVPASNVLMTVENTCPNCAPLTNHLETILTHVWSSSTVATLSYYVKQSMLNYLNLTTDAKDVDNVIKFMLHDFGFRGVSSHESASICGAGHLINFYGTDTIPAIELIADYYGQGSFDGVGYSVPATEHSIMTSLGKDGERDIVSNLLYKYPTGTLSIVGDSYNIEKFVDILAQFKDRILNRDGKVVLRPDSLRDSFDKPGNQLVDLAEMLAISFGNTVNSKGFKELNPKVGLIWGDGISSDGINEALEVAMKNKWSAKNFVFGMGGGLLQKVNRDTQRFAFKSSCQERNGVWHDISKNPLDITKSSKKGKLKLIFNNLNYQTVQYNKYESFPDILQEVFNNGNIIKEYDFNQIRNKNGIHE